MAITTPATGALPPGSEARRASTITLLVIIAIMLAKAIAGWMLNSIALLSEALHTLLDLLTASLAWWTIRAAQEPPDAEHPYGHGKLENLMALAQGGAIIAPALWIGYFSASHLIQRKFHFDVEHTSLGLWVMGGTMVVNLVMMQYLRGVARRTGSVSITANAVHQRVDLMSSIVVFAGLGVIALTKQPIWDALLGLFTALYILWEGALLVWDSAQVLLDRHAPKRYVDRIHTVLHRHGQILLGYSNVRTRMHGQDVHADLDVQFCAQAPLQEIARLTQHLELELEAAIPGIDVHIRPVPCPAECRMCLDDPERLHELVDMHTPVPDELKAVELELLEGKPPTGH